MSGNVRNENLIASFEKGYAKNWHFIVGECFKKELDIELSKRQKNKKSYKVWTQGPYFSFSAGNIFFDSIQVHTSEWGKALEFLNTTCQVTKASPSRPGQKNTPIDGFVEFKVFHTNHKTKLLELDKTFKTTQTEFVDYLKTGQLPKDVIELFDSKNQTKTL
jgi:hypothetical protein